MPERPSLQGRTPAEHARLYRFVSAHAAGMTEAWNALEIPTDIRASILFTVLINEIVWARKHGDHPTVHEGVKRIIDGLQRLESCRLDEIEAVLLLVGDGPTKGTPA